LTNFRVPPIFSPSPWRGGPLSLKTNAVWRPSPARLVTVCHRQPQTTSYNNNPPTRHIDRSRRFGACRNDRDRRERTFRRSRIITVFVFCVRNGAVSVLRNDILEYNYLFCYPAARHLCTLYIADNTLRYQLPHKGMIGILVPIYDDYDLRKTSDSRILSLVFSFVWWNNNNNTFAFIYFSVYRLGGRCYIRVQPGERSELQRRVRILHENGTLPKLGRNTAHLGRHTGWVLASIDISIIICVVLLRTLGVTRCVHNYCCWDSVSSTAAVNKKVVFERIDVALSAFFDTAKREHTL